MPLERYYSLMSAARPVTKYLITRFISRSNGLKQCVKKEIDGSQVNVNISETSNSSEYAKADNGDYTFESRHNLSLNNINVTPPSRIQEIISAPSEDFLDDNDVTLPNPLDTCTEDVSDIGPYLTPTFTFAKYANKSRTIQELVKLGVNLYKFETIEMIQYYLSLDFDQNVKPYIRFLHDCGVPVDYLGDFITKNPTIFKEDMDDLHTRIRYLRAHEFDVNMIKQIICKNPNWLSFNTKVIDGRLGYFQSEFKLHGKEVRILTVKAPKVITYKMTHLLENTFTIKEEMGFDKLQMKGLLLRLPKLWTKNRKRLLDIFEYAHNEMQLQHDFLVQMPHIFLCRKNRLQERHLFLVELKKVQYNPSKPMYVSPKALVSGTDAEFCRDIAKTSVEIYNKFLKTF